MNFLNHRNDAMQLSSKLFLTQLIPNHRQNWVGFGNGLLISLFLLYPLRGSLSI